MKTALINAVIAVVSATTFCFVALAVAAEAECQSSNRGMDNMEIREIKLLDARGQLHTINTHIADDGTERAYGYQYICEQVIDRTAILFVYRAPTNGKFHMSNVKAPLDIGFFDASGLLINQQLMLPYADGESTLYSPGRAFKYALEARQGYFAEHNLVEGKTRLIRQSVYE